jgi:hypothetical protein
MAREIMAREIKQAQTYVVICRDDSDWDAGPYILATRQVFATREGAQFYADGIAPGRDPIIIEARWHQLRLPKEA